MSTVFHRSTVGPYRRVATLGVMLLAIFSLTVTAGGQDEASDDAAASDSGAVVLDVGYMPILPVAQVFVMVEEGWTREAGIEFNLVRFQNGPAMVQAVASGELNVMFVGIGPAMVARGRGQDIRVVASSIVEQIAFIADARLAALYDATRPDELFAAFEEANGRKARIATFPEGSVPYTVLQYWIQRQLKLDADALEVIPMGADQVQQALLSGSVDGASILEPTLTIVQRRDPTLRVLTRANTMFPGQPGAVLAVRQSLIDESPETVQRLVAMHVRATELLISDIPTAARHALEYIGTDLVSSETMEAALSSPSTNYMADPSRIIEAAERMHDFQLSQGTLAGAVDMDLLFDLRFFQAISE
ncbi:MAG: ABC transporter substrate-binding protein [Spirochaetales bacterium]|nr:ABC transporter substrate-binding protein [Spirochaetales bacterium]